MPLLLAGLAIACCLFSGATARAAEATLTVSPAKHDLIIVAGQLSQAVMRLTNSGAEPLPIKVAVMDFAPKDNRGAVEFGRPLPGKSAVAWFNVSPTEFLLVPGQSRAVTATIFAPENTADGSYFAVVMFQTQTAPTTGDTSKATIVPWLGELFLLQVGDLPPLDSSSLTIESVESPPFRFGKTVPVTIKLKNNTNFHITPDTRVNISSIIGSTLGESTENQTIMPGFERIITTEVSTNAITSLARPKARVSVGDFRIEKSGRPLAIIAAQGLVVLAFAAVLAVEWRRPRSRLRPAVFALIRSANTKNTGVDNRRGS